MKVLARQLFCVTAAALTLVAGCSSGEAGDAGGDAQASGWSEQDVTFDADGLTIHGSYLRPDSEQPGPAAVLISESGVTDRNGDNNVAGAVGNMRMLAEQLSDRGVASLRYDKVGTGATGIGPYRDRPADVGSDVYTLGVQSAAQFLADQPASAPDGLSLYGLGEGSVHALRVAVAGDPPIHSVALLQPLAGRYLDLITANLESAVAGDVEAGAQTQEQGDALLAEWAAIVTQVREQGTVPENMNPVLTGFVSPTNVKAVAEADAIDPIALAAELPPGTPVLLTCSDADKLASCEQMEPLIDALGQTDLQVVRMTGVSHVLKDDETDNVANYANGELSDQLLTALDTFAAK